MNEKNYYKVLGVSENATLQEIRRAYLNLSKELHPDRLSSNTNPSLKKLAEERLKLVNEAYDTLKDKASRLAYDESLKSKAKKNNDTSSPQTSEQSVEELLSESILLSGQKELIKEEEKIYYKYKEKIEKINYDFPDQFTKIKQKNDIYLFPDTIFSRLDRIFRIFYLIIPTSILCTIIIYLISLFVLFLIGMILNLLGLLTLVQPFLEKIVFVVISLIVLFPFIIILGVMVGGDDINRKDYSIGNDDPWMFFYYDPIFRHYKESKELGSYCRFYKLTAPIFKTSYVKSIRRVVKDLNQELDSLYSKRKKSFSFFQERALSFRDSKAISNLSYSERFLLVEAMKLKAKKEKSDQDVKTALKVAGGIGLLALFMGGGIPF